MASQFNDLGLGTRVRRLVNKDGSYNVRRIGLGFTTANLYQTLVRMSWWRFILLVSFVLLLINVAFALVYFQIGVEFLNGTEPGTQVEDFLQCFFFSVQTLFTVGYGHIAPRGIGLSFVASIEAMAGLLIFAIITGLMYGRFARPTARILFSENMLVSPYQDGKALMFRMVNKRKSMLMELTVRLIFSYQEKGKMRTYLPLELERSFVTLFPLNWTVVHPINDKSPIWQKDLEFMARTDAEFIVAVKGYDDTFSQEVHAISSYRYDEIVWNASFSPMYEMDDSNQVILDLSRLNSYERL